MRRPLRGMLLHLDGSKHAWLGRGTQDLIVVLDDADSAVYYAQLVEEESTATVMAASFCAGRGNPGRSATGRLRSKG